MKDTFEMKEAAHELMEIKEQIADLIEEAFDAVRDTPEESRAKSYWIAHIKQALDDNHGYLGGSMCTMQDTINDLLNPENEEVA